MVLSPQKIHALSLMKEAIITDHLLLALANGGDDWNAGEASSDNWNDGGAKVDISNHDGDTAGAAPSAGGGEDFGASNDDGGDFKCRG